MSEPDRARIVREVVERVTRDRGGNRREAIFDLFDAAVITREEALTLAGLPRKMFSLYLRLRRTERKEHRG